MDKDKQGEAAGVRAAGPARGGRSVAAVLAAVALLGLLAGCATTLSNRYERRPLGAGTGKYLMFERTLTREGKTSRTYSSRFYGTSSFHGSLTLDVQKTVSPENCGYAVVLEYQGLEQSDIRALAVRVDGTTYRLTDEHPVRTRVLLGEPKVQERYTFSLDRALVGSLRGAGTIKLDYGNGIVNLAPRQESVLHTFLDDTAGLGDCGE
jgi:hypothetical protein